MFFFLFNSTFFKSVIELGDTKYEFWHSDECYKFFQECKVKKIHILGFKEHGNIE